jgi:hypothetical protein
MDVDASADEEAWELMTKKQSLYSPPSALDARSFRVLQIFTLEGERFNTIGNFPVSTNVQMFCSEPSFRHMMNAFITLAYSDYEPPGPGDKEFVYSSILAGIKRMRLEADNIDDEAHLRCRSMLALLEIWRIHGTNDFSPVVTAVIGLFDVWKEEMDTVSPYRAQRRRQIMERYSRVLAAGAKLFEAVKAVTIAPQPQIPQTTLNFQPSYFEYMIGVEIPSMVAETYGFSIAENMNRVALAKRMKTWFKSFEAATADIEAMSFAQVIQTRLYLAHYLRAKILVDACVPGTESRYARHEVDFATILECIERVLSSLLWTQENMWLGVVLPLFFTAVTCRKRAIRHHALSLLRAYNISERSWNSRIAHLIASAVAVVESNHPSSHDGSDAAFVRLLRADFARSTDTITITYVDMSAQTEKSHQMLVLGVEDLHACRELRVWPLVAEVRTHGSSFSRCPLGGPLDIADVTDLDYLKWLRKSLKPRRMELSSGAGTPRSGR